MAWVPVVDDEEEKRGRWVPAEQAPATAYDRTQAGVSGINSGLLTKLLGLPVDTVTNLIDLAKAGYGSGALNEVVKAVLPLGVRNAVPDIKPATAAEMPGLTDRSKVAYSSDWIADQIRRAGGQAMIDANRPDDTLSRYLHAGGEAVGASALGARVPGGTLGSQVVGAVDRWAMAPPPLYNPATAAARVPNLPLTGVRDATMAGAAGAASQGAAEAFPDNPAMAVAAGFAPQAATHGTAAGIRGSVRGGEASRLEMNRRLEALREAGVSTPSVGLATGGRGAQATESLFARTPLAAGVMAKNAQNVQQQMGTRAGELADLSATERGPRVAGQTLTESIADYRQRQQDIEDRLIARVGQAVPPGQLFPQSGVLGVGHTVTQPIPGAPAQTALRDADRTWVNQQVAAALRDSLGTPPGPPTQVPSGILGPNGQPIMNTVPGTPGRPPGVPFDALRQIKSLIGSHAYPAGGALMVGADDAALKALYGGAKQDIRSAAGLADLQRVAQGLPPAAGARMERADNFYAATQRILEDVLGPIHKAGEKAPEKAYQSVVASAKNAPSLTQQTMRSLPAEARSQVAATVIDGLGRAKSGRQTDLGDKFSSETFLTNWDTIKPEAKTALFSAFPHADTVRRGLDNIAKSASMLREKGGVWANPSGSGGAVGQLATAGGVVTGVATGSPSLVLKTLAAPGIGWAGAKLLTNPKFVTWLSQATTIPEARQQQHLARLAAVSTTERDPETAQAMRDLALQISEQR
jgi:hypothetical protein